MNELDLIRAFRTTEGASEPVGGARSAARQRLTTHISPPAPPRRRWLLPAGGVAVAATVAVALALTSGVEERQVAPGDAVAALNKAADAAEHGGGLGVLAADEYYYVRVREAFLSTSADGPEGTWSILVPGEFESWSARDASGRQRGRPVGRPSFPSDRDRERWIAAGRPSQAIPHTDAPVKRQRDPWYLGDHPMSYRELLALPTDPEALRSHIRDAAGDSGSSPDAQTFTLIADTLRHNPVPARLRAALYRAMALVPGVVFRGDIQDRLGRAGLGVSYDDEDARRQLLIFDPDSSAVLEERVTHVRSGELIGYRVVVDSGVVRSTRERP